MNVPRVVRLFQIKNMLNEEGAKKITRKLNSLDGIVRAQTDVGSGIVEIEYENAIIDRYVIREELSKLGFEMLL